MCALAGVMFSSTYVQKLAVVSMRYDAEFGIQNRVNSLFRVSFI